MNRSHPAIGYKEKSKSLRVNWSHANVSDGFVLTVFETAGLAYLLLSKTDRQPTEESEMRVITRSLLTIRPMLRNICTQEESTLIVTK